MASKGNGYLMEAKIHVGPNWIIAYCKKSIRMIRNSDEESQFSDGWNSQLYIADESFQINVPTNYNPTAKD